MAALTAVVPVNAGTLAAPGSVAATDTINRSTMGPRGVLLEIINGNASPDVMTISDAGTTQAGNALASGTYAATVTNATSKVFPIAPSQCDPSTGNVTITHSVTSTVTYKLFALL